MTQALLLEAAQQKVLLQDQWERRLNVASLLKILGVSRRGYLNFKKRLPSKREIRKQFLNRRRTQIEDFESIEVYYPKDKKEQMHLPLM